MNAETPAPLPGDHRPRERRRRRKRPRRRKRQWFTIALLVLLLGAIGVERWLTSPQRLRRLAENYLQSFFHTQVNVASVRVDLFEGIYVTGLTVADPVATDQPLLSCDEVWLQHDLPRLLVGDLQIDQIVATRPVCRARFDARRGAFTLQQALHLPARTAERDDGALPAIRMQEARVVFYRGRETDAPLEEILLTFDGSTAPASPRQYRLNWVAHTEQRGAGAFDINLADGAASHLTGGTPWLSLEAAMMVVATIEPAARDWIELLGVRGQFRIIDFTLGGKQGAGVNELALEFGGAKVSAPLDAEERALPPEERYLRLHDVTGQLRVNASGALAELSGRLDDTRCTARLHLYGGIAGEAGLADVGFDLDVAVDNYLLPRRDADAPAPQARFVNRWRKLRHFYRDFDPHGRVDVEASLSKPAGRDSAVTLRRATVHARGGDVSVRFFPYHVTDVEGEVEITPEGVTLNGLTGRHGRGVIVAHGWVSALRRTSAVDLDLWGTSIPLDDDLCSALPERYSGTWQRFDLDGHADLHVTMSRPEGDTEPARWRTTVAGDLVDAQVRFDGFPYLLTSLSGPVSIAENTIVVEGVAGRCGPGVVDLSGVARLAERDLAELDMRINAAGVEVDQRLLAALPADARAEVAALNPRGPVDLAAQLNVGGVGAPLAYDVIAELRGLHLLPDALRLPIHEVTGAVRIRPGVVEVADVRGQAAGGEISARGAIRATPEGRHADLALHADHIQLTPEIRAALPESAQTALAPWRIDGPLEVATTVRGQAPAGAPLDALQDVTVTLGGATVSHIDFPYPLTVADGQIIAGNGALRIRDVVAVGETCRMILDGRLAFEKSIAAADLTFDLAQITFTETLRNAVPWRWRRRWNDLDPGGVCGVRNGCVRYLRRDDGEGEWVVSGVVDVVDGRFRAGVPLSEINGRVRLMGSAIGSLADLKVDAEAVLDSVRIGKFLVEDVSAELVRGADGRIRGENMRGGLYGGAVRGNLDLRPADHDAAYELNASFQRVAVAGLVAAGEPQTAKERPLPGFADGRFFLAQTADGRVSRRGGGQVHVREAELYRLPFLLNILHVISLSLPEASAFQEASARFYIVGDELRLDDIMLRGSAVALIGQGTMQLGANALDLRLYAVSPHRWAQVPVLTEMLEGAGREIIEVAVTGTLQDPRATARPLRGIEGAMDLLLGPDDAQP